ncbi:MAG: sensor histidine kinase [Novosphingobium sp.]|uniref:HAMP domain-containing histidine kinase n=1 Tax=Novosphingobium sp. TaxID=1874826 RepID=UPI0012CB1469|nr:HAMP domain-containing histidine kinase [Novosphingobium sp.]MPS70854.1 sensor histidine kinase [Novosphingobium sp.]
MHFDDRLATVLRLPSSADTLARIQYRQLIDILGRLPADAQSAAIDAGFARVVELGAVIPAADRARLVRQPLQPLTNPRLLAIFAEAEPEVATAAIGTARLDTEAWVGLVPALPVRARGILRHRRDLGPEVERLLERLGILDRGLPPCESAEAVDEPLEPEPLDLLDEIAPPEPAQIEPTQIEPTPLEQPPIGAPASHPIPFAEFEQAAASLKAPPSPTTNEAGIGAIVRRIEEFRKARESHASDAAPRLPLGDSAAAVFPAAMDFTTDAEGRICWADGPHASALIGLNLAAHDPAMAEPHHAPAPHPAAHMPGLALSMRHRQPLRAVPIEIAGAPAVSGDWQVDAVPHFDSASGRFTGYAGRLRRPGKVAAVDAVPTAEPSEADRMRQVLHELRTPANAIQVAAEIIQQQLYGPAPHEYRALAAAIAGDCAHILAGFEELDRLVKLESGVLGIESGECDLASVLEETVARLKAWTEPRRSGFALPEGQAPGLLLAIDRTEVERLVWRIFAVLAGMTAPDEILRLTWTCEGGRIGLRIALPTLLIARTAQSLFETPASERGQSLSTGMFGIGFTLRLAAAEASAAGGGLLREDNDLKLWLPALTANAATHSQGA